MAVVTLWLADTAATKPGPVPASSIVGEDGDLTAACGDCNLRPQPGKPTSCHAQRARVGWGAKRMAAAAKHSPQRYTLEAALILRRVVAKIARLGMIGNPSAAGVESVIEQAKMIRAAGLVPLGFDHAHASGDIDELRGILMASCDDYAQARDASRRGWTPAVIVPRDTQGPIATDGHGYRYRVCPEQIQARAKLPEWEGVRIPGASREKITCNTCRLCTPSHKIFQRGDLAGIALLETGPRRLPVAL